MTAQIHYAVHSNPFESMVLPASNVDNSEIELEKILNEIGIFGDDDVMVHDKRWEEGTAIPFPSGGLPPHASYDMYGMHQPIVQVIPQVIPQAPMSSDAPMKQNLHFVGLSQSEASPQNGRKRKSISAESGARSDKPQITEAERR
jgi:hypothetical protein